MKTKPTRIILTGFMATGKTVVGELLAKELDYQFLDIDRMVEKERGKTIAEIFEKEGEESFRKTEKKLIKKTLEEDKVVIATGGGAVIDPDSLAIMKERGFLIALSSSVEAILERVQQFDQRPLLKGKDKREMVKKLLSHRSPFYQQADQIVDTTGKKIDETVKEILKILHENSHS